MWETTVVRTDISAAQGGDGRWADALRPAVELLRAGEAVALPTETVYGLAANALCGSSCQKIYDAKKRPSDNPLICHISSREMLDVLIEGEATELQKALMDRFWPGPLTLLFPKSNRVPDVVSCGQPTVAVRMPSHPVARKIIEMCGFPLAAPSANSSGRPSPTTAAHVLDDLNGAIPMIVDGGQCQSGVESTVLDTIRKPPAILRPGGVTFEMLHPLIPDLLVYKKDFVDKGLEMRPSTPGMKYKHYSPTATVHLFEGPERHKRQKIMETIEWMAGHGKTFGVLRCSLQPYDQQHEILLGTSPGQVAKELFRGLRDLDARNVDCILIEGVDENDEGLAVMNRLRKAASVIHD